MATSGRTPEALRQWRDSLVNLSGSNKLLNYRPTRASTLEVASPAATEVFTRVLKGTMLRSYGLRPAVADDSGPTPDGADDAELTGVADRVRPPSPATPLDGPAWAAGAVDDGRTLFVDKTQADVDRALKNLARVTSQEFLDRGIWVLYLAFGALNWVDDGGDKRTSPLLLVPVTLTAPGPRQPPLLERAEEDLAVNPALTLKLDQFGVTLPSLADLDAALDSADLDAVLRKFAAAIEGSGWNVQDRIVLTTFMFAKEAMYRDLLDNEDAVCAHHVVQALAGDTPDAADGFWFDGVSAEQIDDVAPPETTPLVLDADSSQRAAVAAAVAGRSFVLDGPPGTGKSQTIANMIGALLHAGKTVLFVSEKVAALDVVRDRLTDKGLGHYLLELHSHKAVRREVARALGEALNTKLVPPAGMSDVSRRQALELRQALDGYAAAMNDPRSPLGLSVRQVLSSIEALAGVPTAPITGIPAADLDSEAWMRIREQAGRLSRAWTPAAQGATFLWWGLTDTAPLEHRLYAAAAALDDLSAATAHLRYAAAAFELERPSRAGELATVLEAWAQRPAGAPDEWLTVQHAAAPAAALARLREDLDGLAAARGEAERLAGRQWQQLPQPDSLPAVEVPGRHISDPLPLKSLQAATAEHLSARFDTLAEMLEQTQRTLAGIADMLGLRAPGTVTAADTVLAIADVGLTEHPPLRDWLTADALAAARAAAEQLRAGHARLQASATLATPYFDDAVKSVDPAALAHRFATEHKGLKKLGGAYRQDKGTLRRVLAPNTDWRVALNALPAAVEWTAATADLADLEAQHATLLGGYYRGAQTDWVVLDTALSHARSVIDAAGITVDPAALRRHVTGQGPGPALQPLLTQVRTNLVTWHGVIATEPTGIPAHLLTQELSTAAEWLRAHVAPLEALARRVAAVDTVVGHPHALTDADRTLAARAAVVTAQERLESHGPDLAAALGGLYRGEGTDLTAVQAGLHWALRVRAAAHPDSASGHTGPTGTGDRVPGPLSHQQVAALRGTHPAGELATLAARWITARDAIVAAFGPERAADLRADLDDYDTAGLLLEELREDGAGRDDWFTYQQARAALAAAGLDPVINYAIDEGLPADQLPAVIEKALLREWAEHYLGADPRLLPARAAERDQMVARYQDLDRSLISTAVSDIITAANAQRPTSAYGQSAIIAREAEKKTRHMPVRRLIDQARDVIQAIQPCFMMSPLAVSQYLPPDFTFDVVIFDEASQVSPGDAINCIYRGRALITAGDQRQLPPTAFFTVTATADSEEWSDEAPDAATDYESVLDLMKSSGHFTSMTLRWHYRSRHEHLIAYSNTSFYAGRLITFPGALDVDDTVGVKFRHVNGVYRRASGQDNPIEAAEVAQRVLHHFDTRPEWSLGVVTFSAAQREAIEAAVERAREARPDLDPFFTDDRLRGFFVKNLESVQGDERDVMIFSVGYGPDEAGKVYKNFGPLSRAGGERRLNVAITRARYLVEIVSSMTAAQIGETSSEGSRHLRRYLDFAERGPAALAMELGPEGHGPDSPFEESVIATIRSWGYDVQPQVGVAGYRIDIGVRHPDHPGVFVLGVECDGAMYHSSPSARDRDRLRQDVLHGLGWDLHRIWGTAWYRNRNSEQQRLREAIEYALTHPVLGRLAARPAPAAPATQVFTTADDRDSQPRWTTSYRTARIGGRPRWLDLSNPAYAGVVAGTVHDIVAAEGPVHVDVVMSRIRESWGIGRIGHRIRSTITLAIDEAPVARDGDFLDLPGRAVKSARIPDDATPRPVEHVADSELRFALAGLVRDASGISRDHLFSAVTRLFGWQRRAEVIDRLDTAVTQLVKEGVLAGDDDRLTTSERGTTPTQ